MALILTMQFTSQDGVVSRRGGGVVKNTNDGQSRCGSTSLLVFHTITSFVNFLSESSHGHKNEL